MQQTTPGQAPWLSDKDLAARYSVTRCTIWRWSRDKVIPPPRKLAANTSRWSREEIEARDAEMLNGGVSA